MEELLRRRKDYVYDILPAAHEPFSIIPSKRVDLHQRLGPEGVKYGWYKSSDKIKTNVGSSLSPDPESIRDAEIGLFFFPIFSWRCSSTSNRGPHSTLRLAVQIQTTYATNVCSCPPAKALGTQELGTEGNFSTALFVPNSELQKSYVKMQWRSLLCRMLRWKSTSRWTLGRRHVYGSTASASFPFK